MLGTENRKAFLLGSRGHPVLAPSPGNLLCTVEVQQNCKERHGTLHAERHELMARPATGRSGRQGDRATGDGLGTERLRPRGYSLAEILGDAAQVWGTLST